MCILGAFQTMNVFSNVMKYSWDVVKSSVLYVYCAIFAESATGKIAEFLYNTTPAYGRRYRQDEI